MLTGCFLADPGPSRLDVLNDTGSTVWLDDEPTNVHNTRLEIRSGEYGWVSADDCSDASIEAQSKRGQVIATLDREWCPGQLWVIRGAADSTLRDSP